MNENFLRKQPQLMQRDLQLSSLRSLNQLPCIALVSQIKQFKGAGIKLPVSIHD